MNQAEEKKNIDLSYEVRIVIAHRDVIINFVEILGRRTKIVQYDIQIHNNV